MIKALGITQEGSGCSYHRVELPFMHAGNLVDNSLLGIPFEDAMKLAEIVVWNRDFPVGGVDAAKKAKDKYGFKVCVDLDDYWQLYPDHFLYDYWQRNKVAKRIKENIRLADVVTVTTERLAEKVRQYHDNVHVIPNALPYGQGQFQRSPGISPRRQFNFMYAGQKSHLHDVKIIKKELLSISQDYQNAGFVLAGYHAAPDGVWQSIEKEFTSNGRLPNYNRIDNRPLEAYMSVYRHADAVVVPLEQNEFNSYKSNLKILEAAVYGLPVICQQVPPYSDCDAPVLWANDSFTWRHHMQQLISDNYYALTVGREITKWCNKNHHLADWNKRRFEIYKQTICR